MCATKGYTCVPHSMYMMLHVVDVCAHTHESVTMCMLVSLFTRFCLLMV